MTRISSNSSSAELRSEACLLSREKCFGRRVLQRSPETSYKVAGDSPISDHSISFFSPYNTEFKTHSYPHKKGINLISQMKKGLFCIPFQFKIIGRV